MSRRFPTVPWLLVLVAFLAAAVAHSSSFSDQPQSRRLQQLQAALAADSDRALLEFWAEVKRVGTPLIEPTGNRPGVVRVTFLWRGSPETTEVVLLSGPQILAHHATQFARLGDSDVWYLSLEMVEGLRIGYVLAETAVASSGSAALRKTAGSDPLNFRRAEYDPARPPTGAAPFSVFETPNAPAEPWLRHRATVAHGTVETHEIPSKLLNSTRKVHVYRPSGLEQTDALVGSLYLFDGDTYVSDMHIADVLDNLISDRKVKPIVAVLISAAVGDERSRELKCDPKLAEFVCSELLPWIRAHYPVSKAARETIIGGYSLGALQAAFIASGHPDLFGSLLAQSPALAWRRDGSAGTEATPWTAEAFAAAGNHGARVYLSSGRDEPEIGDKAAAFERELRSAGCTVQRDEIEGQHDPINWRFTLPRALLFLSPGPERP